MVVVVGLVVADALDVVVREFVVGHAVARGPGPIGVRLRVSIEFMFVRVDWATRKLHTMVAMGLYGQGEGGVCSDRLKIVWISLG